MRWSSTNFAVEMSERHDFDTDLNLSTDFTRKFNNTSAITSSGRCSIACLFIPPFFFFLSLAYKYNLNKHPISLSLSKQKDNCTLICDVHYL